MANISIRNLAAAIRARIDPSYRIDLYIPERGPINLKNCFLNAPRGEGIGLDRSTEPAEDRGFSTLGAQAEITNFDEEELEILEAWEAGELKPADDVSMQLEPHCVVAEATLKITSDLGKRGGRTCIRGVRITVYDVLSMLSKGVSYQQVLQNFPELTMEDIFAVLAYAADREHRV